MSLIAAFEAMSVSRQRPSFGFGQSGDALFAGALDRFLLRAMPLVSGWAHPSLGIEASALTLSPIDLAKKYCVDDIPSATIPGTQLRPILEFIEAGRPLGPVDKVDSQIT